MLALGRRSNEEGRADTDHHSVNARVEEDEHPDWRRHEANARPHAQHCAGMVVGLQGCASLALCNNDERVEHLVELGEVEPPSPKG